MRENRKYGSEGGEAHTCLPYPYLRNSDEFRYAEGAEAAGDLV